MKCKADSMQSQSPVLGIFVGGQAVRMAGLPKGLLKVPGRTRTIVDTLAERFIAACPEGRILLVGQNAAYSPLGYTSLADDPPKIGPLGGLHALLKATRTARFTLCVACDMPFVTPRLFTRLLEHPSHAPAVAVHHDQRWEPWCARYQAGAALPIVAAQIAAGQHALFKTLKALKAEPLHLTPEEGTLLRDWDSPSDVERDKS